MLGLQISSLVVRVPSTTSHSSNRQSNDDVHVARKVPLVQPERPGHRSPRVANRDGSRVAGGQTCRAPVASTSAVPWRRLILASVRRSPRKSSITCRIDPSGCRS